MVHHLRQTACQFCNRGFQRCGCLAHGVFELLQIRQRIFTGHGFDTAHARGHTALAYDLEHPNVASRFDMGTTAEFAGRTDI